jgi:hypothetical protein
LLPISNRFCLHSVHSSLRVGKGKKEDLRIGSVASATAHAGHRHQCRRAPPGRPAT